MFLATNFPAIFWNCACLIVNAGGTDLLNADIDNENEDVKKKNKNVNYGKISKAIGESKSKGIEIAPPDINKSDLIFKPDFYNNQILYGMKGITRIGTDLVYEIFNNRPYTSITDFCEKVKVNKLQATSLIKSGAFDSLYDNDRKKAMEEYLKSVADQKKRITLQNMKMLIDKDMIPKELDFEKRLFNFNKYIKQFKEGDYYLLDNIAYKFFTTNYNEDLIENRMITDEGGTGKIKQAKWDSIYKSGMDPVRAWMKANQQQILDDLNNNLYQEIYDKYAAGSYSEWEMESLSFYYHDHELAKLDKKCYGIVDFKSLSEEPEVDRTFYTKDGSEITLFKINRIAGTVIDKDKNKSEVVLLTTNGVVTVKIWKNQFAKWDKQLSERDSDGTKHVIERSWFTKGTKLIITGIRRGDNFIPKKYKDTEWPLFEKILSLNENGIITESVTERSEVDD